jgi:hypothetical protein
LHALANAKDKIDIGVGFLHRFIEDTAGLSPMERGKRLQEV